MSSVEPINFPVMNLPIPTAWSNSLSYMEMIGKLVKKMNEIIAFVDDVVAALPIDYNLQQISENISELQTGVTALNTAIGMPYTGTALKTRVGTLEFSLDGYVTSYNSAIGMPYTNTDSLNTRVSALENAE